MSSSSTTPDSKSRWKDVSLAIVTPTLGQVTVGYCKSMIALTHHLTKLNISHGTCVQAGCTLLAEARSALVAGFLASPSGTHLLMVDADEEFAPDVVLRLLAADRDAVGVATPMKSVNVARVVAAAREGHPNPAVFGQEFGNAGLGPGVDPGDGVVEASWLGTGFVMMKRAALERMVAAYPELTCRTSLYPKGPLCFLFQQMVEDGEILGEDTSFFRRWTRIGGKCHVLLDATIGHAGQQTFVGNLAQSLASTRTLSVPRA